MSTVSAIKPSIQNKAQWDSKAYTLCTILYCPFSQLEAIFSSNTLHNFHSTLFSTENYSHLIGPSIWAWSDNGQHCLTKTQGIRG